MKMRILIADDHSAIRSGLKHVLSVGFPGAELGEAVDGFEAIREVSETGWNLLLLDIDLPGLSGFEVLQHIQQEKIKIPVLVFSFHKAEQIIREAFRFGAAGYLTKDSAGELLPLLHRILAGERNVTPSHFKSGRNLMPK